MKLLAATTLVLFAIPAFSATDASEAAYLAEKAKITLTEAVATAQSKVQGTAVSADLDSHRGAVVYEVEVLSGARLFDVRLDAVNGSIISVKEDLN